MIKVTRSRDEEDLESKINKGLLQPVPTSVVLKIMSLMDEANPALAVDQFAERKFVLVPDDEHRRQRAELRRLRKMFTDSQASENAKD